MFHGMHRSPGLSLIFHYGQIAVISFSYSFQASSRQASFRLQTQTAELMYSLRVEDPRPVFTTLRYFVGLAHTALAVLVLL